MTSSSADHGSEAVQHRVAKFVAPRHWAQVGTARLDAERKQIDPIGKLCGRQPHPDSVIG